MLPGIHEAVPHEANESGNILAGGLSHLSIAHPVVTPSPTEATVSEGRRCCKGHYRHASGAHARAPLSARACVDKAVLRKTLGGSE